MFIWVSDHLTNYDKTLSGPRGKQIRRLGKELETSGPHVSLMLVVIRTGVAELDGTSDTGSAFKVSNQKNLIKKIPHTGDKASLDRCG